MKKIYFVCFTAYQLFVCLYYASKLDKRGNKYVLIWFDDNQAEVNCFKDIFDDIHVIQDEYATSNNKYITRIKVRGYLANNTFMKVLSGIPSNCIMLLFSDEHYASNKLMNIFHHGHNNKIILLEEGIGTYAFHKRSFSHKVLLSELIFGCRGEKNIGVSPLIDAYIVKNPKALPKAKHKGRPVIQQNTMFDDKSWIIGLAVLNDKTKDELKNYKNQRILWLGQPLGDCGIDIKTEIGVSNKIIKSLPSDYTTIIKKHPRDKVKKYDYINGNSVSKYFVNHDTWIPAEVLAGMINPGIIISPLSSAGTNLYDLGYGNKVIFCYKLFGISIDESWLEKYKDNKDIYNVSSFDELRAVVKEIQASPERINKKSMTINENKDIDYLNSLLSGSGK